MPELPEVTAFTLFFNQNALNQEIKEVIVKDPRLLKNITPENLGNYLKNKYFSEATRRGKFLITNIAHNHKPDTLKLVIHFGMTGNLSYKNYNQLTPEDLKFAQVIFLFKNNNALLFLDKRKFGKVYLVTDINEISTLKEMGPEPFSLTKKDFLKLLSENKTTNIKGFLLNQSKIAGIGNEYSNEILYQSSINPSDRIDQLTPKQQEILYDNTQKILHQATTFYAMGQQYPKDWLLAHKRDLVCPNHPNHKLVKKTIAGRTAIFCPINQK